MNAATYGWVALGSAIGGVARFWLANFITHRSPTLFPWGTIIVNVTGSFVIGLLAAMTAPGGRWQLDPRWTPFLMAGICGGYTTFSAFSLQTLALAQQQQHLQAAGNVVLSIVLCLAAVWLGYRVGR
jgi:fluoride exporter